MKAEPSMSLLSECVASGQVSAAQLVAHHQAGEVCPHDAHCTNPRQCWEPCGELGHSAEHAFPVPTGHAQGVFMPSAGQWVNLPIVTDVAWDFTTVNSALHKIEREIATEAARVAIECHALQVPATMPPVWDVSRTDDPYNEPELRDAYQGDIARAVRYLDLLGLLVRPVAGQSNLVSFRGK